MKIPRLSPQPTNKAALFAIQSADFAEMAKDQALTALQEIQSSCKHRMIFVEHKYRVDADTGDLTYKRKMRCKKCAFETSRKDAALHCENCDSETRQATTQERKQRRDEFLSAGGLLPRTVGEFSPQIWFTRICTTCGQLHTYRRPGD